MSDELVRRIKTAPDSISFQEVIDHIEENYQYSPTSFTNGKGKDMTFNDVGSNEGSCKIFSFARLNGLTAPQTLACFGDYYRKDVLQNPDGSDHANIRNFMKYGWDGIVFKSFALRAK